MNMEEIIEYCEQENISVEEFFRLYIDVVDVMDCYL